MFAAQTQRDIACLVTGPVDCHFHDLANALDIEGMEWVMAEDALRDVVGNEPTRVVAA